MQGDCRRHGFLRVGLASHGAGSAPSNNPSLMDHRVESRVYKWVLYPEVSSTVDCLFECYEKPAE